MQVVTSGIVTNQYGHVLLIQRDDTLTWAAPGGTLEHGERPTEGVVREVREETGLIVMAVRLVALDFVPREPNPLLCLTFRCIQRGGQIAPSDESVRVGWVQSNELPSSMLSYHRQRVEQALTHTDSAPVWGIEQHPVSSKLFNRLKMALAAIDRDKEHTKPPTPYVPLPDWEIETAVLIQNSSREILWVKSGSQWILPGGISNGKQPPWETAVQVTQSQIGQTPTLTTLAAVYTNQNKLTFVFLGTISETALAQVNHAKVSFDVPDNANSTQAGWINTAVTAEDMTIFR